MEVNLVTKIKKKVERERTKRLTFVTVVLSTLLKINPLVNPPIKVTMARKEKKTLTLESECRTEAIKLGKIGCGKQIATAIINAIQAKNLPWG
jgi:hypothetical protein